MLKKNLFIVAVLLIAGAGYARDYLDNAGAWSGTGTTLTNQPAVNWEYDGAISERKAESWNWPATYTSQDIAVIPVKMDVGFWIKVNNAKDLVLNLKQVSIHKYSGTVDATLVCNVNIKLSVSWSKLSTVNLGGYGHSEAVNPSTLDAPGGTVTISLTLSDVDLSNLVGGTNFLQVGTITLKVVPNVTPQLAGGCG